MTITALAFAVTLGGASCMLVEAPRIQLPDERVTIGDVVAEDCSVPVEARELVVAALPRGVQRARLSRTAVAALVRRRLPGVSMAAPEDAASSIEFSRPQAPADSEPKCYELTRAAERGAALTSAMVAATSCAVDRERATLRYDRVHGLLRTVEDTPSGAYVGQIMRLPTALVEQAQPLRLQISVGPVLVSREVQAAQPSIVGRYVLVRDTEGHVFSAPVTEGGQP